ncbi:hypothetical protein [Spongiactinospora sp. TRM90649]|uniref:hypothetical protein n=1 Tax=Spongiactinospora sp. TRM90649 TaxID=3031114 RepID=UPI0023F9775D|nr:hypothetical protein [Spongiactinospora sp. TRM90649]MDF5759230.1 hypothetical protein [Spongiactinospora sp. TRM90649]
MTDLPQRAAGSAGEALAGLDRLATLPVAEHVAVFEEIHAGLEHLLSTADDTIEDTVEDTAAVAADLPGADDRWDGA